jgi:hypothetical protein
MRLTSKKEMLYANLLHISFPDTIYVGDLSINRDEVIQNSKETKKWLKADASWFDVAVSALHQNEIVFPHDWTINKKQIITFHDRSNPKLPLSSICDLGTVTPLSCDEFIHNRNYLSYSKHTSKMSTNKAVSININCTISKQLFACMPTSKIQR